MIMVAGKTHAEILAMTNWNRKYWYTKISPEEKEDAMEIVESTRRAKISVALSGESNPAKRPEVRAKISASLTGRFTGENHHFFGKTHTAETKTKISAAMNSPEFRAKISESLTGRKRSAETKIKMSEAAKKRFRDPTNHPMFDKKRSAETRARISETQRGENNPRWLGGISFEPYCPKFNHTKKEEIRNRDERKCVLCGKPEILNGQRLSIHHISGNKMMGCNGVPWYLCALCHSCNSKPDTTEKEFLIVSNLEHVFQEELEDG